MFGSVDVSCDGHQCPKEEEEEEEEVEEFPFFSL